MMFMLPTFIFFCIFILWPVFYSFYLGFFEWSPLDPAPVPGPSVTPGTVVDEADYDLIVALWAKACAGVTAAQIEAELAADAFRIHRPLAQWLEEGALRIAEPPPAPAAPAAGA